MSDQLELFDGKEFEDNSPKDELAEFLTGSLGARLGLYFHDLPVGTDLYDVAVHEIAKDLANDMRHLVDNGCPCGGNCACKS